MKKLLTLLSSPLFVYSATLAPLPPVQVFNDGSASLGYCCPVAQTNGSKEILLVWQDDGGDVFASLSKDQGATWSSDPQIVLNGSSAYPFLAQNEEGFLLVGVRPNAGLFMPGLPYSIFYNSSSQSWGPLIPIDPAISEVYVPVCVSTTPQGFLATFNHIYIGYANLSPNGMNWQPSSTILYDDYTFVSSISGCGNQSLLLATWSDTSTGDLYISTSSDGTNWSAPTLLLPAVVATSYGPSVGCFANKHGFLLSYNDSNGNLWSLFSKDAVHWGAPSLIVAAQPAVFFNQIPQISGNDFGFVTAWVDGNGTGFASFSGDNGESWETPVQVTAEDVLPSDMLFYGIAVTVYNDLCIFSWNDLNSNPFVAVSPFPYYLPSNNKKRWGFVQPTIPNQPGHPF